ncbi:hypothetical protein, partial [Heyndrickxia coagulans]|uniref:hypothetical protein n=1 Tax=Heyndrickxia coagulans TaxID=1398 RepID=UPI002E228BC1|nr:hypothetical protein [Heyndrickxia coagulans]
WILFSGQKAKKNQTVNNPSTSHKLCFRELQFIEKQKTLKPFYIKRFERLNFKRKTGLEPATHTLGRC